MRRAPVVALLVLLGVARAAAAPVTAPSGTIVFSSDRTGTFQIYSVRADGSQLGQLTRNGADDTKPLFSPDGTRIAFDRELKGTRALWLMNAEGSAQRKLAAWGFDPAWSPDSRRLAYTIFGPSPPNATPLVIATLGAGRVVIRGRNHGPAWSPDGTWLAFDREVGGHTHLVVVDRNGRGLRTVRRNISYQGALGWTPSGELVFAGPGGIAVVGVDGRGARPLGLLPRWSPDGRRIAFVDSKGRLRVGSAAGGVRRDITPRGAVLVRPPSWSPDGRWLIVESRPDEAVHRDLLVVAADGSSWRRITDRLPSPYGSENRSPSWRPRGATPARLGGAPGAPLPSETVSPRAFDAADPIGGLAANGGRVAIVVGYRGGPCASVVVWEPARRRVDRLQRPCGPNDDTGGREGTANVALAGTRAAWLRTSGGNTVEEFVLTATLAEPAPTGVASAYGFGDGTYGTSVRGPVGKGALLAFSIELRCDTDAGASEPDRCPPGGETGDLVSSTLWRLPCRGERGFVRGCTKVAEADGELTPLAVDGGRIAVRTDAGVSLLTATGRVLRELDVDATEAALSGKRLALRAADAVEVYDTATGEPVARYPVAKGVRLADLEGDVLVTVSGATVTLRRLGGRSATIHAAGAAQAQLEPSGLYVAGAHSVAFTPMQDLDRRLGG